MQVQLNDYTRGADVATDLVNTGPEVLVSSGDGLADRDALRRFLADHGLRPDALSGGRRPTGDDLAAVHGLRRTLRELIETPDEADAAARANLLAARAGSVPALERGDDGRWQWYVTSHPGADLADELAVLAAVGLLGVLRVLSHDRYRGCASPTCNGVFVDTSRAGRRRYCEPDVCGNRINVANHRARRRAARSS